MKKITYISVFAALMTGLFMTSCSNFLEAENKTTGGQTADDIFGKDPSKFLNATYNTLKSVAFNPSLYQQGTDLYVNTRGHAAGAYNEYSFTPEDGTITNLYSNLYKTINYANGVISYAGENSELSQEARFLRNYAYYLLTQQFGGVPYITNYINDANREYPKSTASDIYAAITEDLLDLYNNSSLAAQNHDGRASKQAVAALLAKVYLSAGWDLDTKSDDIVKGSYTVNNTDRFTQAAAWAEKYNQANETDENGYNDDIDKNKRYECKTIYSYIDRSDSNFMFNKTINDALAEDKNLNNYNSQEGIKELGEAIDYSKVDDNYEEIAESFYNSILRYRNTYGNNFAEEITSKNDVVELLYFINQFKDTNIKSTITSKETFESLVDSYYSSCAIYGIEPNMSILFNNYEYGQKKLSEAEKLAANLKNGQGTDYTIPNEYYRWYANNLLYGDDKVLIEDSLKENAPLIAILIEQFKNYRQVGNMLLASAMN